MSTIIKPSLKATARVWWPFFVLATLLSLVIFAVVQQSVRQAADDPQVEFSEQLVEQLKDVPDPSAFFNSQSPTDMRTSLSVFAIAYGDDFQPLASTGQLDGETPKLPQGVMESARDHGENRVTWEPKSGVRIAAVVRPYTSGDKTNYVLVGRSLREVEKREKELLEVTAVGWAATSIGLFIVMGAPHVVANRKPARAKAKPAASKKR